ncbi:MAG: PKD domain-containing protein [Planctomycetaceae bacterium]
MRLKRPALKFARASACWTVSLLVACLAALNSSTANDPRPVAPRVSKILQGASHVRDATAGRSDVSSVSAGRLCCLPQAAAAAPRRRRVLYNFDGDSCLSTKANSKGPVPVSIDDVKQLIAEVAYEGSGVDTVLVCINAQVMYYPTSVGTMRGTLSSPEEREKWPSSEKQRFQNLKSFFDNGVDPYATMLDEAKRRGLEALLTFRMNDDHGNDFLRTQFLQEHPEWRLGTKQYQGSGAMDFGRDEVREYTFRLIEEAVQRYDCDGIELDFNRFPNFFKDGSTEERVAKMDSLVERIRTMLNKVAGERGRKLVLAVRVPSNFGRTPPTPETARSLGCDVVAWVNRGWVDFVAVSEFLLERGDLPIELWKQSITSVPVYGGIECTKGSGQKNLTADEYRAAAKKLLESGADGIYLFNFFTSREGGVDAYEPPFDVLRDLVTASSPSLDNLEPDSKSTGLARPDVEFKIFQFPSNQIPRIDGNADDWSIVPDAYAVGTDQLQETVIGINDKRDPANLDVSVKVGWVKGQNHLYFLYEASDNYWDFSREDLHNDIFEVVVDGDMSGGPLIRQMHPNKKLQNDMASHLSYHGVHAQNYHIFTPAKDKDWAMVWGSQPWIKELPYANAAYKYNFKHGESGRLVLEFFITPFDYAPPAPSRAVETSLEENNVIGLSWAILDYDDEQAKTYTGFWNLSHKTTMYGDASDLVAFRLMPLEAGLRNPVEANWSFKIVSQQDRDVAFRDQSYGNITSWHWDFGDDTSSMEQHPVHRYEKSGEFIVTLSVAGPDGKARRTKVWDVTLP